MALLARDEARSQNPNTMQCSVYIATSLDGFIARTGGGLDWLSMVERPNEDYGYKRFFDAVDTMIVGKNTYDAVVGVGEWPYAGKRCVVLSHASPASRHGEEFFNGTPAELVDRLARGGARRAYVDGGAVIRQFLTADLIDDMIISIIPILLGEGTPLFGKVGRDVRLRFLASRSFESGLAQLEYSVEKRSA
jgi:dihydrofolate reductase